MYKTGKPALSPEKLDETQRLEFASEKEAEDWMYEQELNGEEFFSDHRFAFVDDNAQMAKYQEIQEGGCCGSFDQEIIVDGRLATIGCNFGH